MCSWVASNIEIDGRWVKGSLVQCLTPSLTPDHHFHGRLTGFDYAASGTFTDLAFWGHISYAAPESVVVRKLLDELALEMGLQGWDGAWCAGMGIAGATEGLSLRLVPPG